MRPINVLNGQFFFYIKKIKTKIGTLSLLFKFFFFLIFGCVLSFKLFFFFFAGKFLTVIKVYLEVTLKHQLYLFFFSFIPTKKGKLLDIPGVP